MNTPPRCYFAIATMGRSGSTFLERLLDSHPGITCRGEVFHPGHPYPLDSPDVLASAISESMFGDTNGALGFKLPWEHLVEAPPALGAMRQLGFRLIHLRRRNKLDHALSIALARSNNIWWPQGAYPDQTVSLDPRWLRRVMFRSDIVDHLWHGVREVFPSCQIDYEDAIRGEGLEPLQAFLGQSPAPLQSGIARARTVPRHRAIRNFDDLRVIFANTSWAAHFEDDEHLAER